jgi:serine/threonine protein kinase
VTPKSDVYSLGIAFYQTAVGQAPFTGTPIEVASQHVSREPTVPKVLGANLSDELEALILDCVKKDPDLRPTAQEVHERLQEEVRPAHDARAFADSPISEPPHPPNALHTAIGRASTGASNTRDATSRTNAALGTPAGCWAARRLLATLAHPPGGCGAAPGLAGCHGIRYGASRYRRYRYGTGSTRGERTGELVGERGERERTTRGR